MKPSAADLTLARSQPQQVELYLNIYEPAPMLMARVNNNINRGEQDIPFGVVITGSVGNVEANYVLLVGATEGGNELGTVRVRSASGTYIKVAENSHIGWCSGAYLTVLAYVDVEAIYPRIIQKPGDPEDVIFYKDYDIAYTNQNDKMGSFVCMGPHRAAFRDPASGKVSLYWSSSGTYNVDGASLTFAWEFEGGTPSTSSARTPGFVEYDTAGDYVTKLTVTRADAAVSDVGYRFVSIKDRPDAGPKRPFTKWEMESLAGSRGEGGWTTHIKMREPVPDSKLRDGALVVIFSDEYYGSTHQAIGTNAEHCESIFFVGYILKGSISYDYKQGVAEFDCGSITEMMKQAQGFAISCQDTTLAKTDTWYKINALSIQRALYHYMRWHSTVLNVCDFQYFEPDRYIQYFDTDRESLYDAVARFIETGVKGELVADRQGKLWGEIGAGATHTARTSIPLSFRMDRKDWGSNPPSNAGPDAAKSVHGGQGPTFTERLFPEVSYLEYGGIAYSGISTGTWKAMLACSPGDAPNYKGSANQISGLILTTQAALNQLVGDMYAYANSQYPEAAFSLNGAYKFMDLAPLERFQVNVDAGDTPRGIALINEPFHITSQDFTYFPKEKALLQTAHMAQLVNGTMGQTIPVPNPPKDGGTTKPPKVPNIPWSWPVATGTVSHNPAATYYGVFNADAVVSETINDDGIDIYNSASAEWTIHPGCGHIIVAPEAGWYLIEGAAQIYQTSSPTLTEGKNYFFVSLTVYESFTPPNTFGDLVAAPSFGGGPSVQEVSVAGLTEKTISGHCSYLIWLDTNWAVSLFMKGYGEAPDDYEMRTSRIGVILLSK